MRLMKYIFEIIQPSSKENSKSQIFDAFLMTLIFIDIVVICLLTFHMPEEVSTALLGVEKGVLVLFTIEYLIRIWTAPCLYPHEKPMVARLRYIFSLYGIVDFVAILPAYLPYLIPVSFTSIRVIRCLRLLKMFGLNRYLSAIKKLGTVIKSKKNELLSSLLILELLLIISSVLIYGVENAAQPETFDNAFTGLWWSIGTLTTVGYGDIYPITTAGRLIGMFVSLLGVAIVAIPTGIVSSGFIELSKKSNHMQYCPHCGKKL